MDRLLTETLRGPGSSVMPMDLYRDGETFIARVDLPGVDPDSIDIDVEDRTLTIRAQRPAESVDGAKWLSRERTTGTFARQLSLGSGLALDRIQADYRDGVLTLEHPGRRGGQAAQGERVAQRSAAGGRERRQLIPKPAG